MAATAAARHLGVLVAVLGGACAEPGEPLREGTSVGNPSATALRTAEARPVLHEGETTVRGLALLQEDGTTHEIRYPTPRPLALLGGEALPLPPGRFAAVHLVFDAPLRYRGTLSDGHAVDLSLHVRHVGLHPDDPVLSVDGEDLVLELAFPGWLDELDTDRGVDVRIGAGQAIHDRLVDAIRDASALYGDLDGDGHVDDEERRLRRRAAGRDRRH